MAAKNITRTISIPREFTGISGRHYHFSKLLQARPYLGRVWLATCGKDRFVLKDVPESIYSDFHSDIWPRLRDTRFLRLPCDTIRDERIFVYEYATDDLLSLVRRQKLSLRTKKMIARDILRGIAELHERDIVHLDIKPDNIVLNCHAANDQDVTVNQAQIIDLENVGYLPRGRCIKGLLAGNDFWRSPEAHFKSKLTMKTDMFSFGIVCIYLFLERVIFDDDRDFQFHVAQGVLPAMVRLQRQVSYFGNQESVNGLLKHIADDESSCRILQILWEDRREENIPYTPFAEWPEIMDEEFKGFVRQLTSLDPARRVTARQALRHAWLEDI